MAKRRGARDRLRSVASLFESDLVLLSVVFLVVLLLMLLGVRPPIWVSFLVAIGVVAKVYFIRIVVLPMLQKKVTGREAMIGLQGRVVQPLKPEGTVLVQGEHWKARSAGPNVEVGEHVEVVEIAGLTLTVKRLQKSER